MEPLPLHLIDHALSRSEAQPGDMWRYQPGDDGFITNGIITSC